MELPCQSYQLHSALSEIVSLVEEFLEVMFGTCLGCVSEEILVATDPVLVHEVS